MRSIKIPSLALAIALGVAGCGSPPPTDIHRTQAPPTVSQPLAGSQLSCDNPSRLVVDPYDNRTYYLAFDGDGCTEADLAARYSAAGQPQPIYQLVSEMDYGTSSEADTWLYLWVIDTFDNLDDVKRLKKKPRYVSNSAKIQAELRNLRQPVVKATPPVVPVRTTASVPTPAPVPTKAKVTSPPSAAPAPAPRPQVCTTHYKTVNGKKVKTGVTCS